MNLSPLIRDIMEESERKGQVKIIVDLLQDTYGPVGPTIDAGLALIKDYAALKRLTVCPGMGFAC